MTCSVLVERVLEWVWDEVWDSSFFAWPLPTVTAGAPTGTRYRLRVACWDWPMGGCPSDDLAYHTNRRMASMLMASILVLLAGAVAVLSDALIEVVGAWMVRAWMTTRWLSLPLCFPALLRPAARLPAARLPAAQSRVVWFYAD